MKNLILYAACLFATLSMSGQDISMKNIKSENSFRNRFCFVVANGSNSSKIYSISLEKLRDNKEWYEIKGDVFNNTPTKKTRVFKVTAENTADHCFYPRNIIESVFKDAKYRLKIIFGDTFSRKKSTAYSESFIFKD